jgi:hypothetical protein
MIACLVEPYTIFENFLYKSKVSLLFYLLKYKSY